MSPGLRSTLFVVENLTRQRVIATQIRAAHDSATRRRGLLEARELDAQSGLWIEPCEAVHTFGMHLPLDVLFLDQSQRVRKIQAHMKPNRIAFCLQAHSVLEIKAGVAAQTGTQSGDQLQLRRRPETNSQTTEQSDVNR